MDYELGNQRLGDAYRAALARAKASERFWKANPVAYSVGPGGRIPATTADVLLEAVELGMPDHEYRKAFAALDEWRGFRNAHGRP